MKKFFYIFALLVLTNSLNAVSNKIVATINNEAITEYEVQQVMKIRKINRDNAMQVLIREKLEDEQIKTFGIVTNELEIQNRIAQIASSRGWSEERLRREVSKSGASWEEFKEDMKTAILREKLYGGILQEAGRNITPENARKFYEQNRHKFSSHTSFRVVRYAGASKAAVKKAMDNPFRQIPNTLVETLDLNANQIPAGLRALFEQTPEGKRTQIFGNGQFFEAFLVSQKKGLQVMPFEQVEQQIVNLMVNEEQNSFLDDYFNKLLARAVVSYK